MGMILGARNGISQKSGISNMVFLKMAMASLVPSLVLGPRFPNDFHRTESSSLGGAS